MPENLYEVDPVVVMRGENDRIRRLQLEGPRDGTVSLVDRVGEVLIRLTASTGGGKYFSLHFEANEQRYVVSLQDTGGVNSVYPEWYVTIRTPYGRTVCDFPSRAAAVAYFQRIPYPAELSWSRQGSGGDDVHVVRTRSPKFEPRPATIL